MPKVTYLFPTHVLIQEHTDILLDDHTVSELSSMEYRPSYHGKEQATGMSRHKKVLDIPSLLPVREAIEQQLKHIGNRLYGFYDHTGIRITQSWLVHGTNQQTHHPHTHSNSFLSGVFYIRASDTDSIVFTRSSLTDRVNIQVKHREVSPLSKDRYVIPIQSGDLIVFSSHTTHSVSPIQSTEPRLSLAFNTFLIGILGAEDDANELIL